MTANQLASALSKKRRLSHLSANPQGWAVDADHPLHSVFENGQVWDYLTRHAAAAASTERAAALSYVCAHAGGLLSEHPPRAKHAPAFELLLEQRRWICAEEDALLVAVVAFAGNDRAQLRALVSRLVLRALSVGAVLRELEQHNVVSPGALLDYYRGAALGARRGGMRGGAVAVVEGEHPYSRDDDGTFEHVRFRGAHAAALVVEFDRRCHVTTGARLLLWADRAATTLVADWHTDWPAPHRRAIRFVVVHAAELFIEFRCAHDASPAWGWKVLVREILPPNDRD